METAYTIGREYAEQSEATGPVNVDEQLGRTAEIPDGDYSYMRAHGINPDSREYWNGFNSFFA